ncbi:unnamed protein product [Rangifer tarandus platyrhynchus]|uniref:Uncharacterized protein n=1 Tax=Rangifer tarandus platyrhynchus TaxID=3082113 RepID=A0ABN8XIL4_RANTA|nr:unnamed protein product [Rangifer tarandus platyrhynchus]
MGLLRGLSELKRGHLRSRPDFKGSTGKRGSTNLVATSTRRAHPFSVNSPSVDCGGPRSLDTSVACRKATVETNDSATGRVACRLRAAFSPSPTVTIRQEFSASVAPLGW